MWYYYLIGAILLVLLLLFVTTLICYLMVFKSPKRREVDVDNIEFPNGVDFKKFTPQIKEWILQLRKAPHEEFSVKSFDNLILKGNYYEYEKGAPIELIFHGYKGSSERDLSGALERCFALKRSVFIVDQRGAGKSQGNTITFGIKERKDCLTWIDFLINHFGSDVKIIIAGISMGAATVLMASCEDLPSNVTHILADCPYSSPQKIIKKVVKDMKLSPRFFYPFIKLSGKIFGGFNLDEIDPITAVKKSKRPILLIHGGSDSFVPTIMSFEIYENISTKKAICIIEDAEHGVAYPVDKQAYINAIKDFEKDIL